MKKLDVMKTVGVVTAVLAGVSTVIGNLSDQKKAAELEDMKKLTKEIPKLQEQIAELAKNNAGEA